MDTYTHLNGLDDIFARLKFKNPARWQKDITALKLRPFEFFATYDGIILAPEDEDCSVAWTDKCGICFHM